MEQGSWHGRKLNPLEQECLSRRDASSTVWKQGQPGLPDTMTGSQETLLPMVFDVPGEIGEVVP